MFAFLISLLYATYPWSQDKELCEEDLQGYYEILEP